MNIEKHTIFSQSVSLFRGRLLPEPEAWLAGYSALMDGFDLKGPLPEKLAAISHQHKKYEANGWSIYTPRYKPEDTLASHLTFALKHEGINLLILKLLFQKIKPEEIEKWIKNEPIGQYSRRIWFLYEWLMEKRLALPDLKTGNFIDVLDPKMHYGSAPELSKRHRVRNNLSGVREFCPLIRRTDKLDKFISLHIDNLAHEKAGVIHPDVLARAAAFLLLKDSRASFEIEGEHPGKSRAERWGRAIGQAGLAPLSIQELIRLQSIVIEDHRFVPLGLRREGGFIGIHERSTGKPLPDHISARYQDLLSLMDGMISAHNRLKKGNFDAVLFAALISFGVVFIHPFADGNGRIHRYLMHHILVESGFTPKGIIFPVSAVILEHIDEYRRVLESYSRPQLEFIEWRSTVDGNVEVLNDTGDFYRYFDATNQAEFLYDCVWETVQKTLPEEIDYLEKYDQLKNIINEKFDMSNHLMDLLIRFLQQNKGVLSKRAKEKEFKALSEEECQYLEKAYISVFGNLK